MKNGWLTIIGLALWAVFAGVTPLRADDIAGQRSCENCGMDRKAYGYSRMLLRYSDGTQVATCSLHCAVLELEKRKDRPAQAILVADRDSRELVPAEQAVWVLGGDKRGVMTRNPKWAFLTKSSAQAFIKEHGGSLVDWEAALQAARSEAGLGR